MRFRKDLPACLLTHYKETSTKAVMLTNVFKQHGHDKARYGSYDVHCGYNRTTIALKMPHENDEWNHFAAGAADTYRNKRKKNNFVVISFNPRGELF